MVVACWKIDLHRRTYSLINRFTRVSCIIGQLIILGVGCNLSLIERALLT